MTDAYFATLAVLAAVATVAVIALALVATWQAVRYTRAGWWLHRNVRRP